MLAAKLRWRFDWGEFGAGDILSALVSLVARDLHGLVIICRRKKAMPKRKHKQNQKAEQAKSGVVNITNFVSRWWAAIIAFCGAITVILTFFGLLFDYPKINLGNLLSSKSVPPPKFTERDSSLFSILIFPLRPDNNCALIETDYERLIIERLTNTTNIDSMKVNIKLDTTILCMSDAEADSLGKINNANLVLWGYYDKDCEGPHKIRIKYLLIDNKIEINPRRKKWDSDYQIFPNLDSLRTGHLLDNLELLIHFIEGMKNYQRGYWKKSSTHLLKVYNASKEIEILHLLYRCWHKLGNYKSIIQHGRLVEHIDSLNHTDFFLANSYRMHCMADSALFFANELVRKHPNQSGSYFVRAICYYSMKKFDLAIQDFLKADASEYELSCIAASYHLLGDYVNELKTIDKILAITNNQIKWLGEKATIYTITKDYESALSCLLPFKDEIDKHKEGIYLKQYVLYKALELRQTGDTSLIWIEETLVEHDSSQINEIKNAACIANGTIYDSYYSAKSPMNYVDKVP